MTCLISFLQWVCKPVHLLQAKKVLLQRVLKLNIGRASNDKIWAMDWYKFQYWQHSSWHCQGSGKKRHFTTNQKCSWKQWWWSWMPCVLPIWQPTILVKFKPLKIRLVNYNFIVPRSYKMSVLYRSHRWYCCCTLCPTRSCHVTRQSFNQWRIFCGLHNLLLILLHIFNSVFNAFSD